MKKSIVIGAILLASINIHAEKLKFGIPGSSLSIELDDGKKSEEIKKEGEQKSYRENGHHERRVSIETKREDSKDILSFNLVKKLKNLDKDYISKLSKEDRDSAEELMREIGIILNVLDKENDYFMTLLDDEERESIKESKNQLDDERFKKVIERVREEYWDDDKIETIKKYLEEKKITISQYMGINNLLETDGGKLILLELFYPKVIDKDNGYLIIDGFEYRESAEKAMVVIRKNNEKIGSKIFSDANAFQKAIERTSGENLDEDKLNQVKLIFGWKKITAIQCNEILKTFVKDDMRLSAMEFLYPKVLDKDNAYSIIQNFGYRDTRDRAVNIIIKNNEKVESKKLTDELYYKNAIERIKEEKWDDDKIAEIKIAFGWKRISLVQCNEIIKLFKKDDGRLQALELLYPKLTELDTRYVLLENFEFRSSRDKAKEIIAKGNRVK